MSSIIGAGMTRFGRHPERSLDELAHEAADAALVDAGLAPADIDTIVFANAFGGVMQGQESVRGEVVFARNGYSGIALYNVENACAGGSTAINLAHRLLASRAAENVLVVGAEKLWDADKSRSLGALGTATDVRTIEPDDVARGVFMEHYAGKGGRYLATSGGEIEHFAIAASRSSRNAARNPKAHFQVPVSPDDVLQARAVIDPLTLLMCSPISDGAAALVLTREAAGAPRITGSAVVSGGGTDDPSLAAAARALSEAGLRPEAIDAIEVHDAAISGELLALEAVGVVGTGEAGAWIAAGHTDLDGDIAVNPSGGLVRRGHPIAATGVAQVVELAQQLRGGAGNRQVPDARIAVAHNAGGLLGDEPAVAVVTAMEAA
jgi:acetyl-CoA acyltransferase